MYREERNSSELYREERNSSEQYKEGQNSSELYREGQNILEVKKEERNSLEQNRANKNKSSLEKKHRSRSYQIRRELRNNEPSFGEKMCIEPICKSRLEQIRITRTDNNLSSDFNMLSC
ncbi:superkiller viralicidic activity 2-like 2 [Dorcoceras hygrometricum]|uniref:Superkiller viralicidic activity 2-like 2 n=1 Tax=Dorcoceras hygrometricum TaxID=472368 RepID=A0A2Z7C0J9_9LAMI|nr:superkiller viralicidic activity 2-like 2 [Dorcoceras hygrometricum]